MGAVYSRMSFNPIGSSLNLAGCKPSKTKSLVGHSLSTTTGHRGATGGRSRNTNSPDDTVPNMRVTRQTARNQINETQEVSNNGPRRSARLMSGRQPRATARQGARSSVDEALNFQSRVRRSARIARINSVRSTNSRAPSVASRVKGRVPASQQVQRRRSSRRRSPSRN